MRTRLYLTVLVLALVSLALGGWAVQAARSAVRPRPRPSRLRSAHEGSTHDSRR